MLLPADALQLVLLPHPRLSWPVLSWPVWSLPTLRWGPEAGEVEADSCASQYVLNVPPALYPPAMLSL